MLAELSELALKLQGEIIHELMQMPRFGIVVVWKKAACYGRLSVVRLAQRWMGVEIIPKAR
jgi:hypothetical protein